MTAPMPAPKRWAAVLAALLGLALTVVGAWFAAVVGPSGTVSFSATSSDPVLVPASVLNRVAEPVTVHVDGSGSQPVWMGVGADADAAAVVGSATHQLAVGAAFPESQLQLEGSGTGLLADPRGLDVWAATFGSDKSATTVLEQNAAPQAVLVVPPTGEAASVTVSFSRRAWFYQSLTLLVVGLVVLSFAAGVLIAHRRRAEQEAAV
ncbi:MAG TPA: hypothetical protein PLQ23_05690 [Dermatophilaceae bacterium]|nr:hypothetical protein [Dermatophilaceae bacterium]